MVRFAVRRLFSAIALLFAISVLTFLIFFAMPDSNPALRLAGRTATAVQIQGIEREWGFNKPIYVQYYKTMEKIFNGSVISYTQQLNVEQQIVQDLPPTLSLAIGAGIIWFFFGVVFGVLAAVRAGRLLDRALTVLSLIGVSTPVFFLGAMLSFYLGFKAGLFPNGNYVNITTSPLQWLRHMILPWFTLSAVFIGVYSRVLRSTILDMVNEDFVRTARAKGLTERQVMIRHVLRNSLLPMITIFAGILPGLLGGSVIIEYIFSIPGMGQLGYTATLSRDLPVLQALTFIGAIVSMVCLLLQDICYAIADPRVSYD